MTTLVITEVFVVGTRSCGLYYNCTCKHDREMHKWIHEARKLGSSGFCSLCI